MASSAKQIDLSEIVKRVILRKRLVQPYLHCSVTIQWYYIDKNH